MNLSKYAAIKADALSKKYVIGETAKLYNTMRDSLANGLAKIGGKFRPGTNGGNNCAQEFWALRDISFEIEPGEVVGIVGRNGAGKSTLLKVLSRITEPSSGSVDIYGKVGSLLEVGTGFHNELTGRENLYLSGAILGMKRAEITRQFDEIVAFAEIEKFVDTPVKHYSSGMYLRLAFAVAAHLQPNILLIDEVLAVGDQNFQKKCLGKMDDVAKQGRTVLLVSHNMSAITDLCGRGLLIRNGRLAFDGRAADCVSEYFKDNNTADSLEPENTSHLPFQVSSLKLNEGNSTAIEVGENFDVSLNLKGRHIRNPSIFFIVENVAGQSVVHKRIESKELGLETIDGSYTLKISLPSLWLSPGVYSMYFKFIVPATDWSGRLQSERIQLEVRGELERTGKAVLNPTVEWNVAALERKTPAKIISREAQRVLKKVRV
jgi:lipopolysaccharide transport system ATP-binding protein